MANQKKLLSFVIPVKDEEATIADLTIQIISVVGQMEGDYQPEIVFIDDGSQDGSWEIMRELSEQYKDTVYCIRLRKNCGKSMALGAGFKVAKGDVVFTMDADLQDDPKEIPRFISELDKGFDLVSGWKARRHDPVSKTLPSKLFNKITSWATGIKLRDFNCGFKCYKKAIVKSIDIYGEMHRYIPVLAQDLGYKVGEIAVEHHPRRHGVSKFGWERYIRGFIDLLTVLATTRWLNKPGHLFGGLGVVLGLVGGGILSYLTVLWFLDMGPIGDRPLLIFGVLICILSFQMISLGVIAELIVRVRSSTDIDKLIEESIT